MNDNTPRPRRNIVESADFDIDFTRDGDCPTLSNSYRSATLQSEESLSDYKSLASDRHSWHKSTLSVTTQPDEFHDCELQLEPSDQRPTPTPTPTPTPVHAIISATSQLSFSDHGSRDSHEEVQQTSESRPNSVVNTSNGNIRRSNLDIDDDDELLQIGNRHRRVSFMETNGNGREAQPSEINIFGKMKGNSFFHLEFTWKTLAKVLFSIVMYFFDVYSDVSLAVEFMSKGLVLYCWLTAGVVIFQMLISSIYDVSQFRVIDRKAKKYGIIDKVPSWLWVLRTLGLLLGIVPVYRTILYAIYAYKATKAKVKHERSRFALLLFAEKMSTFSLFIKQSYFESAPQMILQLYIMFRQQQQHQTEYAGFSQIFSVSTSLLSFAWALLDYDSNCAALFFNVDFTFFSNVLIFLWRLFTTFSQTALFALLFVQFPLPFFFVSLADYVIMIAYSCLMANTGEAVRNLSVNRRWTDCYTRLQQCRLVFFVNVFSALPLLISFVFFDQHRREIQVVCYYSYRLVYSSILMGLWAGFSQHPASYRYGYFFGVLATLVVGVLFLGLYVILYHKPKATMSPKFRCVITSDDVKQENLANSIEFIKLVSLKNMAFSYQHLE